MNVDTTDGWIDGWIMYCFIFLFIFFSSFSSPLLKLDTHIHILYLSHAGSFSVLVLWKWGC